MARHFEDATGRRWDVQLTPVAVARVRDQLGLDLDVCGDPAAGAALLDALVFGERAGGSVQDVLCMASRLANLLYLVCRDQAEERGVSDADFGRLVFRATDGAVKALLQEVQDVYPAVRDHVRKRLLQLAKTNLVSAWRKLLRKLRNRK